jgi:hypothetical protein
MIERINSPLSAPAGLSDYQAQNALTAALMLGMQMPVKIVESDILPGSLFYVGGTLYKATSYTAITGVSSDYVKLTPNADGSELAASYVASLAGVTWNSVYKGYYDVDGNLYVWDFAGLNLEQITSYENKENERFSKQVIDWINENIGDHYIYNVKQAGNALSHGGTYTNICKMTSSRVCLNITQNIYTYDWDGESWTLVGSGINIGGALYKIQLARLDNDIVATHHDRTVGQNGRIITYQFNGSTWAQVGNIFSVPSTSASAPGSPIARMTGARIAFFENVNNLLHAIDWDGTDWSYVGNSLSVSMGDYYSDACGINETTVAYMNVATNKLEIYTFDGTDWSLLTSVSLGSLGMSQVAYNGNGIIMLNSENLDNYILYNFDGATLTKLDYSTSWPLGNGFGGMDAISETEFAATDTASGNLYKLDLIRYLVK